MKKTEENLYKLWDTIKQMNIWIMEVPEVTKGAKSLFKK